MNTPSTPSPTLLTTILRSWLVVHRHPARLRCSHQGRQGHDSSAGFSILEVLVAMIISSLMVAIITPPIFMAAAARVQQRRAQQSLMVAQSEIDRVRATVERGVYTTTEIPVFGADNLSTVAAPTVIHGQMKSTVASCNTYNGASLPVNTLLPVDIDGVLVNGQCRAEYLVQTFRTNGPTSAAGQLMGFQVMVRVYANVAQQNLGQLRTERADLLMGSGSGGATRRPLAVLKTSVVRPDASTSLQNYRDLCTLNGCQ